MTPAVSAPPYFITADDKRGLLVVTGAVVLAYVWTCFLIRICVRWQTREWRADDWALAVATFLSTAQSAVVFHLVSIGLGATFQNLSQPQLDQVGKEGFALQLLYIYVLCVSKLSVLFLYLRLAPGGSPRMVSLGVIAASVFWALLATILIATPCNPLQAVQKEIICNNRWSKWQAIGALDIVTEIVIIAVAVQLVWGLQMRTKAKVLVILAFSARLPVIAIAGARLFYLWQRLTGRSSTFEYVVATQWQIGYAIISSTITGMGPFLRPFSKESTTNNYKKSFVYGYGSQKSTQLASSARNTTPLHPGASWRPQGYLMETFPSLQGSQTMLSESMEPAGTTQPSGSHVSHASTPTIPESTPSSSRFETTAILTADGEFWPTDCFQRHEVDVWAGSRSRSLGHEDGMLRCCQGRMVVNKRTDISVEIDCGSPFVEPAQRMSNTHSQRC